MEFDRVLTSLFIAVCIVVVVTSLLIVFPPFVMWCAIAVFWLTFIIYWAGS